MSCRPTVHCEKKKLMLHIKVPSYKLNNPASPGLNLKASATPPGASLLQCCAAALAISERPSHSGELDQQTRPPGGASSEGRAEEMGRAPCCDKATVKKGPWGPEEDAVLKAYIDEHGAGGNWIQLPHKIGRMQHPLPIVYSSA
jgi:hypothetical protein